MWSLCLSESRGLEGGGKRSGGELQIRQGCIDGPCVRNARVERFSLISILVSACTLFLFLPAIIIILSTTLSRLR